MANDETDRLLSEIGLLLSEDTDYPLDGTLLYARVDSNSVAPAIFKDGGSHVMFRWPDLDRLGGALLDLWDAEDQDKQWSEIEYVIRDGKFRVEYLYADEIDPNEELFERRDRIVKRNFGDKPITYPPFIEEDEAPSYEL